MNFFKGSSFLEGSSFIEGSSMGGLIHSGVGIFGVGMVCALFVVFVLDRIRRKNKAFQKEKNRRILDLEMVSHTQDMFFKRLCESGGSLVSELERDALLKKIRDSFETITKVSAGYLLLFNQNKDQFEWGIGLSLNPLKLKKNDLLAKEDPLIRKILSQNAIVQWFSVVSLMEEALFHVREEALAQLLPFPEELMVIKMKMKTSLLGLQFLLMSKTQAQEMKKHQQVLNVLVNQATLALGSAVQRQFAIFDRMTMLVNHEYFLSRLRDEIVLCERTESRKLTLIMLDIDHFKKFNDTHGHQMGDFVLIEVAKLLKENVRISDIVARYGGEEFAIILHETSLSSGKEVAEKIRSAIETHPFSTETENLSVTISLGLFEWKALKTEPMDAKTMIKGADDKLYESKEKGRNCLSY